MYYPKSKISTGLHTNGGEFIRPSTNELYVGYYWKTSTGKCFTGKDPKDKFIEELLPYIEPPIEDDDNLSITPTYKTPESVRPINEDSININDIQTYILRKQGNLNIITKKLPFHYNSKPLEEDYEKGYYMRYFVKKTNERSFMEVNEEIYNKIKSKDVKYNYSLYVPFEIKWHLTGNKESVEFKNRLETSNLERNKNLWGLTKYIKDYSKFLI